MLCLTSLHPRYFKGIVPCFLCTMLVLHGLLFPIPIIAEDGGNITDSVYVENSYLLKLHPDVVSLPGFGLGPGFDAMGVVEPLVAPYLESVGANISTVITLSEVVGVYHDPTLGSPYEELEAVVELMVQSNILTYFDQTTQTTILQDVKTELESSWPEAWLPFDTKAGFQSPFYDYHGSWVRQAWGLVEEEANLSPITVAVIDTGIRAFHEDLKDNLHDKSCANGRVPPECEIPDNGLDDDKNGCPDDVLGCAFVMEKVDDSGMGFLRRYGRVGHLADAVSHGSSVSGIIGASTDNGQGVSGVAGPLVSPENRLLKIRSYKTGGWTQRNRVGGTTLAVLKAFEILKRDIQLDKSIKILNWSGRLRSPGSSPEEIEAFRKNWGKLVCEAVEGFPDIVFVLSSPSTGENLDQGGRSFPQMCDIPNKLIVTPHINGSSPSVLHLDFGYGVKYVDLSTDFDQFTVSSGSDSSYAYFFGSSASAPMVSGVAAMIWSMKPEFTASKVIDTIRQSVVPVDSPPISLRPYRTSIKTMGKLNACHAVALALGNSDARCDCCEFRSCGNSQTSLDYFDDYYYREPCTCIFHEIYDKGECKDYLNTGKQIQKANDQVTANWFKYSSGYYPTDAECRPYPWDADTAPDPAKSYCPPKEQWTHKFLCVGPGLFKDCPCVEEGEVWDCNMQYSAEANIDQGCKSLCGEDEVYVVDANGKWHCCPEGEEWNDRTESCEQDPDSDPSLY